MLTNFTTKQLTPTNIMSMSKWEKIYILPSKKAKAGKEKVGVKGKAAKGKGKGKGKAKDEDDINEDIRLSDGDGDGDNGDEDAANMEISEERKKLQDAIHAHLSRLSAGDFKAAKWQPGKFTDKSPTDPNFIASHLCHIIQNVTSNRKLSESTSNSKQRDINKVLKSCMDQFFERRQLHESLIRFSAIVFAREDLNTCIRRMAGLDELDEFDLDDPDRVCYLDLLAPSDNDELLLNAIPEDEMQDLDSNDMALWEPFEKQIRAMGKAMNGISGLLQRREKGSSRQIVVEFASYIKVSKQSCVLSIDLTIYMIG